MILFDGNSQAALIEKQIAQEVLALQAQGTKITIASVLFTEDAGSQLYTQLKKEAAQRVGIEYALYPFSLQGKSEAVVEKIRELNTDPSVTGIIIQKPWQRTWQKVTLVDGEPKDVRQAYQTWWHYLTSSLTLRKDVDGLHPETLAAIKAGTWRAQKLVMPATARAVLEILQLAEKEVSLAPSTKSTIIGRSDLLGLPLYYELLGQGKNVELLGKKDLDERIAAGKGLTDSQVVVSATGVKNLITGELLSEGAVVIDVGEPQADVEAATVAAKAAYLTPVPGGVGPMTVVSLLQNAVQLAAQANQA